MAQFRRDAQGTRTALDRLRWMPGRPEHEGRRGVGHHPRAGPEAQPARGLLLLIEQPDRTVEVLEAFVHASERDEVRADA